MRRLALSVSLSALAATTVAANPVPTEVAERFRSLVEAAAKGACPDREGLVRDFGRFGLDLLTDANRQAILDEFDRFAPILVDAQRPGHELSHDIELLFLTHASDAQQRDYRDALLEWMTAKMDKAPASGSMIVEYEPDQLPRVLNRHRAYAAQMLADFGDARVVTGIRAMLSGGDLDAKTRRLLERTQRRFDEPCVEGVIAPDGSGALSICIDADDVAEIQISGHRVDGSEVGTAVELLRAARWVPERFRGSCCDASVQLTLDDGSIIRLDGSRDNHFRIREKGSPYRRQWLVASADLWGWVQANRRAAR